MKATEVAGRLSMSLCMIMICTDVDDHHEMLHPIKSDYVSITEIEGAQNKQFTESKHVHHQMLQGADIAV